MEGECEGERDESSLKRRAREECARELGADFTHLELLSRLFPCLGIARPAS
jgi:hypothetical protein